MAASNGSLNPLGLDYITLHDGSSTTLLLSENAREATYNTPGYGGYTTVGWTSTGGSMNTISNGTGVLSANPLDQTFGINWKGMSGSVWSNSTSNPYCAYGNLCAGYPSPTNAMAACLNSNHGGGVLAAFCDGHVAFLRNDVDQTQAWTGSSSTTPTLFDALVTPDGQSIMPPSYTNQTGEPAIDEAMTP